MDRGVMPALERAYRTGVAMALIAVSTVAHSQSLPAEATVSMSGLPSAFVPNVGQWDPGLLFAVPMSGGAAQLRSDGIWFHGGSLEERGLVRLSWDGADYRPTDSVEHPVAVHIYGPGAHRWEDLPGRTELELPDFVVGTDLRVSAHGGGLQVAFDGSAGTVPILHIDGASLPLLDSRTVALGTEGGALIMQVRSAEIAGRAVEVRPVVVGPQRIAFEPSGGPVAGPLALQVDLVWSTFLGGSSSDNLSDLVVLSDGSVVAAGTTLSLDFPVTPDAAEGSGTQDVNSGFLSRLSADGSTLLYSTYLTSAVKDVGLQSVFAYGAAKAGVTGFTESTSLPTTANALQPSNAGFNDGFIAEFDLDTGALTYCSYLGTDAAEVLSDGAYAPDGTLYLVGKTTSPSFPTTPGAYQPTKSVFFDGIVVRLDTSAARSRQLLASTFLGASGSDSAEGVRVASSGEVAVFGTASPDFPLTPGAYDSGPYPTGADFVCRMDCQLESLLASTFLPNVVGIALRNDGAAAFCSWKSVAGGATTGAFDETFNGGGDAFVGLMSADATTMEWATFLGGTSTDGVLAIDIDDSGAVVLTGQTSSADFPTTPGAFEENHSGGLADVFVSFLTNNGSTLGYSTFLGPSTAGAAYGTAIHFVGPGEVVVGGKAVSPSHPVTPGAYDEDFNNIFISHLAVDLTWADLEHGLAGSAGIPILAGSGDLTGGSLVTLDVSRCLALSTAWYVLGLSKLQAPFKGGTLVPSPDVYAPVPVNGTGQASVSFTWPVGIPAGVPTYYQVWVVDPVGPKGFSASNGLQGLAQ